SGRNEYNIYQSLDKNKNEPAWSPDGKLLAFTDNNRIWVVSPDGGEPTLVYENYHEGFSVGGIESLCFTPDGKELIFKKDIYDVNRGSEVIIYNLNKNKSYGVIENEKPKNVIGIFSNPIPNIESVNILTGEHRIIVENGLRCNLSKNGKYLCYINWSHYYNQYENGTGIHGVPILYEIETGIKTVLSLGENRYYGKPTFSPDDSHIVIPIINVDEQDEFYLFPVEGGEPEKLVDFAENYDFGKSINFPEYSPDGKWVLYTDLTRSTDGPSKQLFLYSAITGERFSYFENPLAKNSLGKWSPDGKSICYLVEENDGNYLYISDFDSRRYELNKPAIESAAPLEFSLNQNYPNPFNMKTTIEYSVPEQGFVNIVIYNNMGQKVRELVSEDVEAGVHSAVWDGCDENGNAVSSGMYISRLVMGDKVSTSKKMTLIK
ncbi:FlgD immunoglobulin-like domain containing protein, partial [Candidatus Latescibacterota bacterium]